MSRLTHSGRGLIRAIQMSRAALNVFVEGNLDVYFYGQICAQDMQAPFSYHIIRSNQLPTGGHGKSALLKFFKAARRRKFLDMDFKGQRTEMLFFLDKDLDDLLRKKLRSAHLVYTEYYELENYLFKYGNLVESAAVACLQDIGEISRYFPPLTDWSKKAAELWRDWLELCLAGVLLKAPGVCNFRVTSEVNLVPMQASDASLVRGRFLAMRNASQLSEDEFDKKFATLHARVEKLYRDGRQDIIFRGKWYENLLSDELQAAGLAFGSSVRSLPDRISHHLMQSLDFSQPWAEYFRLPVQALIS